MVMRFDPFRELDRLDAHTGHSGGGRPPMMAVDAHRVGDRVVVHFDNAPYDMGVLRLVVPVVERAEAHRIGVTTSDNNHTLAASAAGG